MRLLPIPMQVSLAFHGDDNVSTTTAVPIMTSDTSPSGVCSASSVFSPTYPAWHAFDATTGDWWASEGFESPSYLQYKFATATPINKYILYDSYDTGAPKSWTILASNTGAFTGEETLLDTRTNNGGQPVGTRTFGFLNSTSFLYYRIFITENNGSEFTSIAELQLIRTQGL